MVLDGGDGDGETTKRSISHFNAVVNFFQVNFNFSASNLKNDIHNLVAVTERAQNMRFEFSQTSDCKA